MTPNPPVEPTDARDLGARASGFYVAAAVLLALTYFGAVLLGTGGAFGPAVRATLLAGAPCIAVAYLVVRVGRRVRWFDGRRGRIVWLHAALCLGYAVV